MYELNVKIKDNWYPIDLGSETPAINISRNDISELKDRNADYSQSLRLPKSANNCLVFDHIDDFQSISLNNLRHKRFECELFYDSFRITRKGCVMRFVSVSTYFEVQILGAEIAFFEELKKSNADGKPKDLNDLDFIETIIRGIDGVYQSTGEQSLSRHSFYGIADFSDRVNGDLSFYRPRNYYYPEGQVPFIWYKSIINQILQENGGYTLESDISDNPLFDKACIPFDGMMVSSSAIVNLDETGAKGTNAWQSYESDGWIMRYLPNVSLSDSNSFLFSNNGYFTIKSLQYSENNQGQPLYFNFLCYKPKTSGTYTFNLSFDSWLVSSGSNAHILGLISLNSTNQDIGSTYQASGTNQASFLYNRTASVNLTASDFVVFVIYSAQTEYVRRPYDISNFRVQMTNFIPSDVAGIGLPMPIKGNLPEMTQVDFFKTFLQLYGLTMDVDEDNKIIRAYTFDKVVQNKTIAKDWSDKFNLKSAHKEKFIIGSYGKRNYLKFKTEELEVGGDAYTNITEGSAYEFWLSRKPVYYSDTAESGKVRMSDEDFLSKAFYWVYNNDYKNLNFESVGYFEIDDDNLKDEHNFVELPFQAEESCRALSPNNFLYGKIVRYNTADNTFSFDSPPVFAIANVMKEVQVRIPPYTQAQYAELPVAVTQRTGAVASAQSLVRNFYSTISESALADVRLIEDAEFYLSAKDVQEFDPFTPVYVDYFGAFFYVNKIKNFRENVITKVDLVKIR